MRRHVPLVVPSMLRTGMGHGGVRQFFGMVRGYVYAVYKAGDNEAPKNSDPNTGVMCDVLLCEPGWSGLLRHVPVQVQSGGISDHEHWRPRAISETLDGTTLNLEGGLGSTPLHETDGDLVIVAFLGGDINRPVIMGQLSHPGTANTYAAYEGYRWARILAGNVMGVDNDGNVVLDAREGSTQVTIQTDDDTTIVANGKVVTVTSGDATVTIDGNAGAVTVDGVDTTVKNGKLYSKSGDAASTQAVVLAQAHTDIVSMLTTIGGWFASYGTALIAVSACDAGTVSQIATDLGKLTAALNHLAANTESD